MTDPHTPAGSRERHLPEAKPRHTELAPETKGFP
jgi:hypothetical protein